MFSSMFIRLSAISMTIAFAVSILAALTVTIISPSPAYADHNSLYMICPDPIQEGNTGQLGVRRSGYDIVYAVFFTHHGEYSANPNDFEEYHGVKFESGNDHNTLWVPIVTKEDAQPEHDETFAIGFQNDGVWHQCIVTIEDDDAPAITGVHISSEPTDRHAYRAGDSIDVIVDTDFKVEVEDTPHLALFFGDGDESAWRGAEYLTGSGSRHLVFRYRVQAEDRDTDGISVGAAAVADDRTPVYGFSGNIYAEGTDVPINYTHAGVKGDWRQQVDGRPYVQSARITSSPSNGRDSYRANETIEVSLTFDTKVVVEGEVTVDLNLGLKDENWDEAERKAAYLQGSGTDTLVFGYTVRMGDMDSEGVGIVMGAIFDWNQSGFDGSGTIKARGTEVERNPWYLGTGHQPDHKVDTEPPTISSLSITSSPANGTAYEAGEQITIEAAFNELVTADGEPQLELSVGDVPRYATVVTVPEEPYSNSLVFQYEVQEGDEDSDGIGIGANAFKLNGGGINDSAGNDTSLTHDAIPADPHQKVDSSSDE